MKIRTGLFYRTWFSVLVVLCMIAHAPVVADSLFETRLNFWAGNGAISLARDDMNGDGHLDLAVANFNSDTVSVLLGNGDATFQPRVNHWPGDSPVRVASSDLNGDGHPDLVVVNYNSNDVSILLGNGDGTFLDSVEYPVGQSPYSVAVGDFNEDGNADLAVTNRDTEDISILLGNGNGTLQEAMSLALTARPDDVITEDLDQDGHLDLTVVGIYVFILSGNGDGTFSKPEVYEEEDGGRCAVGDLNGDGDLDLAMVDDRTVTVMMGNGDGTFQSGVEYDVANSPESVAIGDLDHDGHDDLTVGDRRSDDLLILHNNGDGTFEHRGSYSSGEAHSVVIGDFNEDGNPDLASTQFEGDKVTLLLGKGDGSFAGAMNFAQGDYTTFSVAVGDLNDDGILDLVAANDHWSDKDVSVMLGNGDGTFPAPAYYEAGEGPRSIALADLNGDGDLDSAVANDTSNDLSVMLGNGDGTLQTAVNYATGGEPMWVSVGQLNGDDSPDLVTANVVTHTISVLLNNGDGTFHSAVDYGVGAQPLSLAIGDLGGDGIADLVVANNESDTLSILQGIGDGTFLALADQETGEGPRTIAMADLNEDGNQDLAVVVDMPNDNPAVITVLLGNGDNTFKAGVDYDFNLAPQHVAVDDLDGDGILDLVTANHLRGTSIGSISVLRGIGDGNFRTAITIGAGESNGTIAIGDLDRDGDEDMTVANGNRGYITVFKNISRVLRVVVGPGPAYENTPLLRLFPLENFAEPILEFPAYSPTHYGVNVTCGAVNGGGLDQIISGAGPGEIYGPHVRGFMGDGTPLPGLNYLAYGTNHWGVNVAAGDIDGDGFDEIITGAGPGAVFGPHVRGWNYDGSPPVTSVPEVSYFAYGTPKWGVNVATGDIDGDGFDEIVTGAGPGAVYGPHVRGWNVDGGSATAMPGVSFLAYGTNKYGVNVTCGDVDGDGIDELVTGPGPGQVFGAHIRGWNYDGTVVTELPGINFFAWQAGEARYGAKVSSGIDLNGDGVDELVVGCGPDPNVGTPVKVYLFDGVQVTVWLTLEAFEGMSHGTNVAAGLF